MPQGAIGVWHRQEHHRRNALIEQIERISSIECGRVCCLSFAGVIGIASIALIARVVHHGGEQITQMDMFCRGEYESTSGHHGRSSHSKRRRVESSRLQHPIWIEFEVETDTRQLAVFHSVIVIDSAADIRRYWMTGSLKRWLAAHKAWFAGFVSAVAAGLLVEWLKNFPISRATWIAVTTAAAWLASPVGVPRGLALGVLVVIVVVVVRLVRATLGRNTARTPQTHYTEDSFLGVMWRWEYFGAVSRASFAGAFLSEVSRPIVATRPAPTRTLFLPPQIELRCDICAFKQPFEGKYENVLDRVTLRIEQKVNSGEWEQSVQRSSQD